MWRRRLPSNASYSYRRPVRRRPASRSFNWGRIIFALMIAGFALISYHSSKEYNPVTGEEMHISLTPHQEIALGLRAAPEMMMQHGGEHPNPEARALVDRVGNRVIEQSSAGETEWQFDFHLLRDPRTINAFALPGGQIFITAALLERLETEGQLAGVLGHEAGHVVARHSAQRIAKQDLTQGITGAVLVAAGTSGEARMAALVGNLVNMKYGREDELQSDELGVRFMSEAGYDPRAMIEVQKILDAASGGARPVEFLSTHPNAGNRIETIEAAIAELYPSGVPPDLE